MVKQVAVFLENKQGRLVDALQVLQENNINIRALSIAETTDFGIIRLIVNKPQEAVNTLKQKGFRVMENDVLAVEVPDNPGGLAEVLAHLSSEGVNIEYMYAFAAKNIDDAIVIFRVKDRVKAQDILKRTGAKVLSDDVIYSL